MTRNWWRIEYLFIFQWIYTDKTRDKYLKMKVFVVIVVLYLLTCEQVLVHGSKKSKRSTKTSKSAKSAKCPKDLACDKLDADSTVTEADFQSGVWVYNFNISFTVSLIWSRLSILIGVELFSFWIIMFSTKLWFVGGCCTFWRSRKVLYNKFYFINSL